MIAKVAGNGGLRLKVLLILIAFALVPMISVALLSMLEMDQASKDVQDNISSLSTTLNRSALTVAPNEADQVQLAIAKARQYDEFFSHIAYLNELVASYASEGGGDADCTAPPGIWLAPIGPNETLSERRSETIQSLCAPAGLMSRLIKTEPQLIVSYIGTEDGVLMTWPYSNETFSNTAPFGYREMSYYEAAKSRKRTIWTGPSEEKKGDPAITVTTPIHRAGKFAGIAGMEVSLVSIYKDMDSMKGRGYPFLIDGTGRVVIKPKARPDGSLRYLFEAENLSEADILDVRSLAGRMLKGTSGSVVIDLRGSDCYVAFSPIATLGWRLGIAYPAEEMSLPARFIDAGIRNVAEGATQGLNDATRRMRDYTFIILALTAVAVVSSGLLLGRRIDDQIDSLVSAAERISRGEFDITVRSTGELGPVGQAFNRMSASLKGYTRRLEGDAEERGGSGREAALLKGIKHHLTTEALPQRQGYEICALYCPSDRDGFEIYDVSDAGDQVVVSMAGVGGGGIQAAILAIMSRALLRASHAGDPAIAIADLNAQINQHAKGMNLACFYSLLDPQEHSLEYVNAGYNPPFIVDPSGMVDTLGGGGIALGMLDRLELKKVRIPLQPGDVMVIYSDGVVQAKSRSNKPFGVERLIDLTIRDRGLSAPEILKRIEGELSEFSSGRPEADVALVIIKREPNLGTDGKSFI
ncbi:MAG: SpoIIE family protein phosphatase [Methanothrix sp.]|nr:SpoIIE family protein phosphatase [Methanothrix sp.]